MTQVGRTAVLVLYLVRQIKWLSVIQLIEHALALMNVQQGFSHSMGGATNVLTIAIAAVMATFANNVLPSSD